jgi:hypothetical protein
MKRPAHRGLDGHQIPTSLLLMSIQCAFAANLIAEQGTISCVGKLTTISALALADSNLARAPPCPNRSR